MAQLARKGAGGPVLTVPKLLIWAVWVFLCMTNLSPPGYPRQCFPASAFLVTPGGTAGEPMLILSECGHSVGTHQWVQQVFPAAEGWLMSQ